jgi:hypothetical protein
MKYIVEDPRTREFLGPDPGQSGLLISTHYFFYDQSNEKSFTGMIAAILYQIILVSDKLISPILPVWNSVVKPVGTRLAKLTSKDIEDCLLAISRQKSIQATICIFIDGLDECIGNWHAELEFLTGLVGSKPGQRTMFKACISSRPENTIRDYLKDFPGLRIHERTFNDVLSYVNSRLADKVLDMSCRKQLEPYTGSDLIEDIVKKASGVFIWVRLAVDELVECFRAGDDLAELRARLSDLPPDLEAFYGRILDRIPDRYIHETMLYFALVSAAETAETHMYGTKLSPFRFSLAIEPAQEAITCTASIISLDEIRKTCERVERRIQSRCRSFLEIDTTGAAEDNLSGTVKFLHKTGKDYIAKEETQNNLLSRSKCCSTK